MEICMYIIILQGVKKKMSKFQLVHLYPCTLLSQKQRHTDVNETTYVTVSFDRRNALK